jgi:peptide/nickel transport system permease protein
LTEGVSVENETVPPKYGAFRHFRASMQKRRIVVLCIGVLSLLILVAIFAPLVAPYSPVAQNLAKSLQKPSPAHLLGTDILGRDVFSRIVYGTRVSLSVGLVSVAIAGSLGMLLGLVSGVFGGWVEAVIMRVIDMMMSIPLIILAIFIGSVLGKGLTNVMISVGIAMIPSYARLTRGQVKSIKQLDFIVAGTVSGTGSFKTIFRHVLPNSLSPNIVLMTMNLGSAILIEASLSFLGLGISPPMASWGAMIADGYSRLRTFPLLSIAPGIVIMVTVLAFNVVGDALRDALDPRLRGAV